MTNPHNGLSDQRSSNDARFGSRPDEEELVDEERVASMADEGGVSGALMEIEDTRERKHLMSKQRHSSSSRAWRTALVAAAIGGVAFFIVGWVRRSA